MEAMANYEQPESVQELRYLNLGDDSKDNGYITNEMFKDIK